MTTYTNHRHFDVDVFTGSRPDPSGLTGAERLAVLPNSVKNFVTDLRLNKDVADENIYIHTGNKFLFIRYYVDWN